MRSNNTDFQESMSYPVGTVIENITFVLLDKNNQEISDYDEWLLATTDDTTNHGYTTTWSTSTTTSAAAGKTSKKSGRGRPPSKNKSKVVEMLNGVNVPDIKCLDQEDEISYTFELFLNGTKLEYEFTIRTEPGM